MTKLHKFFTLTCLLAFIYTGCAVNPVTGQKELMLMSEQQEIALGQQSDPAILAQFGTYQDEKLQKFIEEKGKKMAAVSHRPHLPYEFKIVDSPVVNAFAVPGGYVYFTRGIMAHFNNEAEFAGVLGHEIGHVTARHSARQYSNAQLAQVLFVGGMIASKEFRQFASEAQQAMGLLFLKFGRDNESESDRLGVEYSTKIGYDAQEMAGFFETLNRLSVKSGAGEVPTFLSTHPHPIDRFNKVKQLAGEWQAKDPQTSYQVNRNSYLQMIDGLVYGEDPRQGYVDNNVFYHPELLFQYPVPQGWRVINSPTQVQMAPADGKALMVFTLSSKPDLQSAAQEVVEHFKLTVRESKNTTVNGFPAGALLSEQITQNPQTGEQQSIVILTYLIQYDKYIYVFHGLSLPADFNTYAGSFSQTMTNFKKLTDPRRINVKPERIAVRSVPQNMTLSQVLSYYKIPQERHEELAVLNSMNLNDALKRGTYIKIIGT